VGGKLDIELAMIKNDRAILGPALRRKEIFCQVDDSFSNTNLSHR